MKPFLLLGLLALGATACGTKADGGGSGAGGSGVGGGSSTGEGGVAASSSSSGEGGSIITFPTEHPVCTEGFVDYDCDADVQQLGSCPSDQHVDLEPGDHCASCVADTPETTSCEWGRARYLEFLAELATASCADLCDSYDGCMQLSLDTACFSGCALGLRGNIDEEIVIAADAFAKHSCSICGDTPPPCPSSGVGTAVCVDNRCVLR